MLHQSNIFEAFLSLSTTQILYMYFPFTVLSIYLKELLNKIK